MRGRLPWVVLLLSCTSLGSAGTSDLDRLTAFPAVLQAEVSPSGQRLALLALFEDGEPGVLYLDVKSLEVIGALSGASRTQIGRIQWASDEHIIGERLHVQRNPWLPPYLETLFVAKADGSRSRPLRWGYGFTMRVVDPLDHDSRRVLIAGVTPYSIGQSLLEWDLRSGHIRRVYRTLPLHVDRLIVDGAGRIRLLTSQRKGVHRLETRSADGDVVEVPTSIHGGEFDPIGLGPEAEWVYALDRGPGGRLGIHRFAPSDHRYELVYEHPHLDVVDALLARDGTVYGAWLEGARPHYVVFPEAHRDAAAFRSLLEALSGSRVRVVSQSRDGRLWVVHSESDVDPGRFYLFAPATGRLTPVAAVRPDVSPAELASMEPIEFRSFDGRIISGYLTRLMTGGVGPLVVRLHDGPARRDYWRYHPEVQALAGSGYSVLQLNYRGSAGYGMEFEDLGSRGSGADLLRDVEAGVRWAIEQGHAEAGRICVMESGFGAYAAIRSAMSTPDLFQCVVANVARYDSPMWPWPYTPPRRRVGEFRWELGRASEADGFAPLDDVQRLEAPVLLASAGHRVLEVPFIDANVLRKRLEAGDKPYVWFDGGEPDVFDMARAPFIEALMSFLQEVLPADVSSGTPGPMEAPSPASPAEG